MNDSNTSVLVDTVRGAGRSSLPRVDRSRIYAAAGMLLLCLAATLLLGWRLGERDLADWDEAIYAQVAKEMVESGGWLTLQYGGELWFEKPPLGFWMTAAVFRFFGISELSARLVSMLSAVGIVALVFLLGKSAGGIRLGLVAALILVLSRDFVQSARSLG